MSIARSRHTATLLKDGRVLVAGGRNVQGSSLRSAELYDPGTETWQQTGNLTDARAWATATLLREGQVLVTGGVSDDRINGAINNSAEIYDPRTGAWTIVDHMANARYGHQAGLLSNGIVLVTGGAGQEGDCIYKVATEIYDPQSNRWTNVAPMMTARGFHSTAQLADGRILVIGGLTLPATCNEVTASTEVYDLGSQSWTPTGNLKTARSYFRQAAVLVNGKVLIAGGRTESGPTATAELFDPAAMTWSMASNMLMARRGHTMTVMRDGRVLIAGGDPGNGQLLATAEVYSP
jgi:N-acetylneuraminic acid mutarotase